MKILIKPYLAGIVLAAATCSAYGVGAGPYFGVMTGPATNTGKSVDALLRNDAGRVPVKPNTNQWGTRVLFGNKFNEYAGIEGGVSFFTNIKYKVPEGADVCSRPFSRIRDADITGRASYTFYGFEVFGKAGAAYVYQTNAGSLNRRTDCKKEREAKFRPTFSLGGSYDLTQNWVIDASWNRILVGKPINNLSFFGLGITYHFVDVFCGQFLC